MHPASLTQQHPPSVCPSRMALQARIRSYRMARCMCARLMGFRVPLQRAGRDKPRDRGKGGGPAAVAAAAQAPPEDVEVGPYAACLSC
jgi:hypothetical protein